MSNRFTEAEIEKFRKSKHPSFHPKKTIAVTQRVLSNWCLRSNAYLDNVEHGLARAERLKIELGAEHECPGPEGSPVHAQEVVAYDNLEYAMEKSLKAAMMVDGYHGLNKGLDGIESNCFFERGLRYVFLLPEHRLDRIHGCLSEEMRSALDAFLPLGGCIQYIYEQLHSEMISINWSPGPNYSLKKPGRDVRWDSKRYTSDWIHAPLDPKFVAVLAVVLRELNAAIPMWFKDKTLTARSDAFDSGKMEVLRFHLRRRTTVDRTVSVTMELQSSR